MGEFTIAETAPALVLPALTLAALAPDVVAQALAPVPMQVALRVATAAPAQAPAPAASKGRPTRVAAERQAGPWTVSKSAQPQRKQASARLAAAVIATAKPILAGRGEAKLASRGGRDSRPSVDQSGKASFQVASRHVATMAEASEEEEVDLKWVPKVLDGAN